MLGDKSISFAQKTSSTPVSPPKRAEDTGSSPATGVKSNQPDTYNGIPAKFQKLNTLEKIAVLALGIVGFVAGGKLLLSKLGKKARTVGSKPHEGGSTPIPSGKVIELGNGKIRIENGRHNIELQTLTPAEKEKEAVKGFIAHNFSENGEILTRFTYVDGNMFDQTLQDNLSKVVPEIRDKLLGNKAYLSDKDITDLFARVQKHIDESFPDQEKAFPLLFSNGMEPKLKGQVIRLGEFIKHKIGVCRHMGGLTHTIFERINLTKGHLVNCITKSNYGHTTCYFRFNQGDKKIFWNYDPLYYHGTKPPRKLTLDEAKELEIDKL